MIHTGWWCASVVVWLLRAQKLYCYKENLTVPPWEFHSVSHISSSKLWWLTRTHSGPLYFRQRCGSECKIVYCFTYTSHHLIFTHTTVQSNQTYTRFPTRFHPVTPILGFKLLNKETKVLNIQNMKAIILFTLCSYCRNTSVICSFKRASFQ